MRIAGYRRGLVRAGLGSFAVTTAAAVLTAPAASAAGTDCLQDRNNVYVVCPVISSSSVTVNQTYTLQAPKIGTVTFVDNFGGSTVTVSGTQTVTGTGDNQVVSVQWTPTTAGEHQLVVRIQANNVVKEYQPKTVTVAAQPPIPGAGSSGF